MSTESDVWEAVLEALREQRSVSTDQLDVEGIDPKTLKRVLYEVAETGWVERIESRDEWGRGTWYGEITPRCYGAYRHAWDHRDEGDELRKNHRNVAAADEYSTAAHAYLGDEPPALMTHAKDAVEMFLRAAICYRLGDVPERGNRRCSEGSFVVEDVIENAKAAFNPEKRSRAVWFGAWYEYLGDLRLHGNVGDPNEAYDRAQEIYANAEPTPLVYDEAENRNALGHFNRLVRSLDTEAEQWRCVDHPDQSFTRWLAYKREHLPQMLDELYETGEWV